MDASNKFKEQISRVNAILDSEDYSYLLVAVNRSGNGAAVSCHASEEDLRILLTLLVNKIPQSRNVFDDRFVALCKHAPHGLGATAGTFSDGSDARE